MPIRQAVLSDAPYIHELINQFVASGTLLERSLDFIEKNIADYVIAVPTIAVLDSSTLASNEYSPSVQVLACAQLDDYSKTVAELRSLAVHPSFQSQGLGRQIVNAVIDLATFRGHALLFAVSYDQAFFESFGFAPRHVPELDPYRSEFSSSKGVFAKDLSTGSLSA